MALNPADVTLHGTARPAQAFRYRPRRWPTRLSGRRTRHGALLPGFVLECTAPFVQFPSLGCEEAVPSVEHVNGPGGADHQPSTEAQQHQDGDDPEAGHSDRRDAPLRQFGSAPLPAGSERGPCAALHIVVDMIVYPFHWDWIALFTVPDDGVTEQGFLPVPNL